MVAAANALTSGKPFTLTFRKAYEIEANSLYFASKAANIKKSTVVPLTVHEKEIFDLQQKLGTMELKIQHLEDRKTYLEDKLQQNDIEFDPDQDENGGS